MTETKEVSIPAAGDPFTAREVPPMDRLGFRRLEPPRPRPSTEEAAGPTTEDFAAARRAFHAEMNTGPDPYSDPARWIGCTDGDDDERPKE